MGSKIVQISPCNEEWYYLSYESVTGLTIYRVAVWALFDDGTVQGMVSVRNGDESNGARLVGVPQSEGEYKHITEMRQSERDRLASYIN